MIAAFGRRQRRLLMHPLFFRLVTTYAIVLLLPTFLVLFLIRWNVKDAMIDQAVQGTTQNLERLSSEFDGVMLELDRIAVGIVANRHVTRSGNESAFGRIVARNQIQSFKFISGHVYEILHIRFDDPIIYGANVVTDADSMLRVYYPFPETSLGRSMASLRTVETRTIERPVEFRFPGAGVRSLVPYFWPFPSGGADTVVLFLIDVQSVRDLIARAAPSEALSISIESENGEILFSWSRSSAPHFSGNDIHSVKRSRQTGLVYRSTVLGNTVLSEVSRIQALGSISLVVVFLVGVAVIALGIRSNYRPIRVLADSVAHYGLPSDPGIDEVERVRIAVDSVVEENRQLTARLEVLKPVMREHLVRELIDRAGPKLAESSRLLLLIDNNEPNSSLLVVGSVRLAAIDAETFEQRMSSFGSETTPNWAVAIRHDDPGYATLVAADEGRDAIRLKRFVRGIVGCLPSLDVGFSCMYHDILQTSEAYVQSARALRASMSRHDTSDVVGLIGDHCVVTFFAECQDDLRHAEQELVSRELELFGASRALSRHLESGNAEGAQCEVDRVFESVSNNGVPPLFARCAVFDLYNVIFRLALRHNVDLVQILGSDASSFVARAHRNLPDLVAALRLACVRLVAALRPNGPVESPSVAHALKVLYERFCEPTFTLEGLADEIGVSLPHLSRVFRQSQSVTLSHFLWGLRQERAKCMLTETDMSVNEIARAVGYTDTSSFIRRFKSIERVPPGEWRDANMNSKRTPSASRGVESARTV